MPSNTSSMDYNTTTIDTFASDGPNIANETLSTHNTPNTTAIFASHGTNLLNNESSRTNCTPNTTKISPSDGQNLTNEIALLVTWATFFLALCFLVLNATIKLKTLQKIRKLRKEKPNERYELVKKTVKDYFDKNFEALQGVTKNLIMCEMKEMAFKISKDKEKLEREFRMQLKEMKTDLEKTLLDADIQHRKLIHRAVSFEIKSRMIKHPFDVRGMRRSKVFETHLYETWQEDRRWRDRGCVGSFLKIPIPSCCKVCFSNETKQKINNFFQKNWGYIFGTWRYLIMAWGIYLTDNITDIISIKSYTEVAFNVMQGDYHEDKDNGYEKYQKHLYAMFIFFSQSILTLMTICAFVHTILRKCIQQTKASILFCEKINNIKDEENDELLDPFTTINRYILPLLEADLESVFELVVQGGVYTAISYAEKVNNCIKEIEEEEGQFKFTVLWISWAASICSLTNGQSKAHMVQNEYNISLCQEITYHIACLFCTLSYTALTSNLVTGVCDLFLQVCWRVNDNPENPSPGSIPMTFVIMFAVGSAAMIMARFSGKLSESISKKITGYRHSNANKIHKESKYYPFFIDGLYLPTSKKACVMSNHVMFSPQNYYFFITQSITFMIYLFFAFMLTSINTFALDLDTHESLARTNMMKISVSLVPFGWILSYFFLWVYFKMDKGFFTIANLEYKYNNAGKKNIAEVEGADSETKNLIELKNTKDLINKPKDEQNQTNKEGTQDPANETTHKEDQVNNQEDDEDELNGTEEGSNCCARMDKFLKHKVSSDRLEGHWEDHGDSLLDCVDDLEINLPCCF